MAPLLPKLRGHFAEFLHHDSLDLLGILYLTTCVGFGYGQHSKPHVDAFLGSIGSPTTSIKTSPSDLMHMSSGFANYSPYILGRIQPFTRFGYLPASHLLIRYPHQFGSPAPPTIHPKAENKLHRLSITSSDLAVYTPVREYQPVIHRLRLSASP